MKRVANPWHFLSHRIRRSDAHGANAGGAGRDRAAANSYMGFGVWERSAGRVVPVKVSGLPYSIATGSKVPDGRSNSGLLFVER